MFFCDCMVSWLMGFGCGVSGLLHFKFLGLYGFVAVFFFALFIFVSRFRVRLVFFVFMVWGVLGSLHFSAFGFLHCVVFCLCGFMVSRSWVSFEVLWVLRFWSLSRLKAVRLSGICV